MKFRKICIFTAILVFSVSNVFADPITIIENNNEINIKDVNISGGSIIIDITNINNVTNITNVVTETETEETTELVEETTINYENRFEDTTKDYIFEQETETTTYEQNNYKKTSNKRTRKTKSHKSGSGKSSLKAQHNIKELKEESKMKSQYFDKEFQETSSEKVKVSVQIGINKIELEKLDGSHEVYDIDAAPYIQKSSNSTLVPLRCVSIALGADSSFLNSPDKSSNITWDSNSRTATVYYETGNIHKYIQFTDGSNIMMVNGNDIYMANGVKAEINNGRIFVPFRALGEAMEVPVTWDNNTKKAIFN